MLVGEHAQDKAMEEDEMQNILQAMTGQAPTEADEQWQQ
jgi:hypothetical protein